LGLNSEKASSSPKGDGLDEVNEAILLASVQTYLAKCQGKRLFRPFPESVLFFNFLLCFSSLLSLLLTVVIVVPHLFYPLRIGKILQIHRSLCRMNLSFLCCPFLFARSAAQKRNGKVRQPTETHFSSGGFLTKREPRVPETAADTQLGFGQL
jgi:hypothetical protein